METEEKDVYRCDDIAESFCTSVEVDSEINSPRLPAGLKNNHNNCWLNSLLQSFLVTTLGNITAEDAKPLYRMMFSYLAMVLTSLKKTTRNKKSTNPSDFLKQLHKKCLKVGKQHDAHEAFSKIMEMCSSDLGGTPIPSFSAFWGAVAYKSTCCTCGFEKESAVDKFHSLAVELPRKGNKSSFSALLNISKRKF